MELVEVILGWEHEAAVLQENDKEFIFEMAGHEEETTNNRMELDAVISGLKEILILEEEKSYFNEKQRLTCV